jgi:hypothetical protein
VFDLRYHVASLAAVFLALVIGILVGVGLTRGGFVSKAERSVLQAQATQAQTERDAARRRANELQQEEKAALEYIDATYSALAADRLRDNKVVLVSVGPLDGSVRSHVIQAIRDGGGPYPVRIRALKVPVDPASIDAALAGHPALAQYTGDDKLPELGRALAGELVKGGRTPLWDSLASELVEERVGGARMPADGVVVARSVKAQRGRSAQFLRGFYSGLADASVPAVGVEVSGRVPSALGAFRRATLSTVDSIDAAPGRLALVLLLAGAPPGNYGVVDQDATDGVLPLIPPLAPAGG